MKISVTLALLLAASAAASTTASLPGNTWEPPRVSLQELENLLLLPEEGNHEERDRLQTIFQEVGLLSITDIPGFAASKPNTLQHLPGCAQTTAARHTFPDGTLRQTLATTPGQPLILPQSPDCHLLEENARGFRETVAEVSRTVAALLQALSGLEEPLLLDKQSGSYNLEEIVHQGQQLEHFHVYHTDDTDHQEATLDWHTDQGLLLLFTPGLVHGAPSHQDFYVQLSDGPKAVEFSPKDELVIMLGEGVHQYINPHLKKEWRAVPHALRVQQGPRTWYGLMVLPPSEALHPVQNDRTFGELRDQHIADATLSFGCGTTTTTRNLQEETEESCTPDAQHYCWHRCMNYTDVISPEACAAVNDTHEVACVNPERQLWTGDHDSAFGLGCIDIDTAVSAGEGASSHGDANDHTDHSGNHTDHSSEEHTGEGGEQMDKEENGDTASAAAAAAAAVQSGWVFVGLVAIGAMLGEV